MRGWHSNACALYTCYRSARALTTSSVHNSNARGKEKERYTKVESRREKERVSELEAERSVEGHHQWNPKALFVGTSGRRAHTPYNRQGPTAARSYLFMGASWRAVSRDRDNIQIYGVRQAGESVAGDYPPPAAAEMLSDRL
ncbi:hypothetical protein EVAR_31194_1 [Eumeta japonica]|uniref:Uncharacterized protein n=1 Tax=Eumeta variegata TaxID=151549 RepID=A0A4C1VXH2_EUMVA|nr:hypothetical protein EVAR_31194_1 [Eumeta japonica]